MSRHPTIDLSAPVPTRAYPIPIQPYSVVLESPQSPMVKETPAFESEDIPGFGLIIGGLGLAAGGFLGWTACNLIVSTEFYQNTLRMD